MEFGGNLEKLVLLKISRGRPSAILYGDVDLWERREIFDLGLKSQPVLYRELREAHFFADFYLAMRKFREMDAASQDEHIRRQSDWIDSCIRKGDLSRRKLNAAFPMPGSKYAHPIPRWLNKQSVRISHRNIPKVTKPGLAYTFPPVDTLPKKLRALWTGVPGAPREHRGPPLVGEQVFGDVFKDLGPNTQKSSS